MSDQDVIRACASPDPDWAVQRIEDYVTTILAAAPPLTGEQRDRLAELLKPVRVNGGGTPPKKRSVTRRRPVGGAA